MITFHTTTIYLPDKILELNRNGYTVISSKRLPNGDYELYCKKIAIIFIDTVFKNEERK